MVAQNSAGDVWLHRKSAWRLPTGTMRADEDPVACVERETEEEFGKALAIVRPLAKLKLTVAVPNVLGVFESHMFLLDCADHEPAATDASEGITGWKAISIPELYNEADRLRSLAASSATDGWRLPFWGKFRAIEHELVADLLLG